MASPTHKPIDREKKPSPQNRLKYLLVQEKRDLLVLFAYGVAAGVLFLVVPIAIQIIVNTVGFGLLLQPLLILSLIVLVVLTFAGGLQAIQTHVIELMQRRIFARMATTLAERLPRVPVRVLDGVNAPELVNRFFDVLTVQKSAAVLLLDGMTIVVQSVIGLTLMAFYHPVLLGFNAVLIALLLIIFLVLGAGSTKTALQESKSKYAVAAWLEEIVRHPMTFRSSGGGVIARRRADQLTHHYLDAREGHFRVVFRQVLGALALQAIVSFLLLAIGSWLVTSKQLSLGQLVAAEFIVSVVTAAFAKLGKHVEVYYDLLAALDKLGQLTDLPADVTEGSQPSVADRPLALKLQGVSYEYDDELALDDITLKVRPGEKIALTGIHGAGKSTFMDVLYGVRPPTHGHVLVDGVNLRELDALHWRKQVEIVRENEVFDGSLLDNVRLGRDHVDEAAVREALEKVGLDHIVGRLPRGLHTELATGGGPLSPGQAHRLMLARAIVDKPRLLLLDEALGHLDSDSEAVTLRALFASDAPWTLIACTYNLRAIELCDRVFEMRWGRLHQVDDPHQVTPRGDR